MEERYRPHQVGNPSAVDPRFELSSSSSSESQSHNDTTRNMKKSATNPKTNDKPHTGTVTCSCARCLMPGNFSFADYQHHVDTKVEAGRRQIDSIDDQLARCHELLGLLNDLEDSAMLLGQPTQQEISSPLEQSAWSPAATGPPSPLLEADVSIEDDEPPSPLSIEDSPFASRRQTICALSSLSSKGFRQQGLSHTSGAGASFDSAAASSFYSEQALDDQDEEQPLTLPPALAVPRRASSIRQANAKSARLSKPFNEQWVAHSPETGVSAYDLLTPRSEPPPTIRRHSQRHPQPRDNARDKPLPPLQRMYTPRTASTTELLGSFSPDLFPPDTVPYATPTTHSRASSIFHRRKGVIAMDSDDCDSSGSKTPQHTFKWNSQRVGGMRLKPKRRNSKADELLGLGVSSGSVDRQGTSQRSLVSRAGSVLSSRETLNESAEGKKEMMSLLKLSKLRKGKESQ